MAANLTNYLEKKLLDHFLAVANYAAPGTIYCGLITSVAVDADLEAGTLTNEVTGGTYARQVMAFSAAATPGGTTSNSGLVTFPDMPAGTVAYGFLSDAITAGNMLVWAPLTVNRTLIAGDTFVFPAASFAIALA